MASTEAEESGARWSLAITTALTLVVNLPLIASNTIFGGDDWAWVWTYRAHGAGAVFRHLLDAAHPGFAPVLDVFFWLGGEIPGRAAHAVAITCHLCSGLILWRIFNVGRSYTVFATTISLAYLVSPFLGGLRGSMAHDTYDVFILAYFFSILLSSKPGIPAQVIAVIGCIIGLSIETLAVLEFIRWWHLYHSGWRGKPLAYRVLPYLLLIAILYISRATWLIPKGVFAGYNALLEPSAFEYIRLTFVNLWFFADIRKPLALFVDLARHDNPWIVVGLILAAAGSSAPLWRTKSELSRDHFLTLGLLGFAVLFVGMAPYVAIGREASLVDVSSRFAVASQFGAFILGAATISALRPAALRSVTLAAILLLFTANQIQLDKWLIYEGRIVGDFRRQVGAYLVGQDPQVLLVDFHPPTMSFLYLGRACLSSYDTNVSLELAAERNGSFVYDRACGEQVYADPAGCLITGYETPGPCPSIRRSAEFTLDPRFGDFTRLRLFDLVFTGDGERALPSGTFKTAENVTP
jgi:hypothetical protein